MPSLVFTGGTIVLEDRVLGDGSLRVDGDRITALQSSPLSSVPAGATIIDLNSRYLVPGYVDLHVHGGAGADFMDGTEEAFRTVCRAHLHHGTTSLLPTTTVARHEQHLAFLKVCRRLKREGSGGARV